MDPPDDWAFVPMAAVRLVRGQRSLRDDRPSGSFVNPRSSLAHAAADGGASERARAADRKVDGSGQRPANDASSDPHTKPGSAGRCLDSHRQRSKSRCWSAGYVAGRA
jgi:hypothetical protein